MVVAAGEGCRTAADGHAPGPHRTVAPLAYVHHMNLEFAITTAQPAPVGPVADRHETLRPTVDPVYVRPRWGDVVAEWACPVCGTSCNRTYHSGRARVYCTNACRQRAYRLRRRSVSFRPPPAQPPHRSAPGPATACTPSAPTATWWPAGATPRVARSPRAVRSHAPHETARRSLGTRISSPAGRRPAERAPPCCTSRRPRWRPCSNGRCGMPKNAGPPTEHPPCSPRLQCSHGEQQTAPGNPS